ncbi:MAG: hypothetical protein JSU05_07565, partial [Bacteroidetes bacterium]|nr:hypothetical protein [Bacteroidota bacterium]
MEDQLTSNKSELWSMSVKDLFFKYVRFIPVFIVCAAVALFVAYAYLRYATPIYRASGTLMIKSDNNQGRNDKFEEMFMSNNNQNIQSEMEVLKSRPLMERVVKKLNLQVSYYAKGKIKSPNIYGRCPFQLDIFEIADSSRSFSLDIKFTSEKEFHLGNEKNNFKPGDVFKNRNGVFRISQINDIPAGSEYMVGWQPIEYAAASYAAGITVQPKTVGTGLLIIQTETPSGQMGADIINRLMEEYQVATVEDKNATADSSLNFIDKRVAILEKELDSIEKKLLAYMEANNLVDVDAQTNDYLNAISESDKQVNDQRTLLSAAEMLSDYLQDKKNEFNTVPSPLGLSDPTLLGLIEAYNTSQLERKSLMDGGASANNVIIQQKGDEIEKLRLS